MKFVSTRNINNVVSFADAITNCVSPDGGLYVPAYADDLGPWIYYSNDSTSFASMAGALTSALIKDEFSPIISEAIATGAFPFSPVLKQLDESLYELDLFTGPTGSHKDFGVSYLLACLEYTLLMQEKKAIVVAVSNGEIGSCVSYAMKGKKHIKALLLYAKGKMRGFEESDCVWNGGNIYPVEVDGTLDDCNNLVKQLFSNTDLVSQFGLTVANTMNIGRLLPQTFFYMYAFSRLKNKVFGDIFYAMAPGNYGNLVAGLYGWKFSLPVHGFITECTPALNLDSMGQCQLLDSLVPMHKRKPCDPGSPSNLERLEEVFFANPAVLKGMVFPSSVTKDEKIKSAKELYMKYGILADFSTAGAYAAAKKHTEANDTEDSAIVLVYRDHPCFRKDEILFCCGESPKTPDYILPLLNVIPAKKQIKPNIDAVVDILKEMDS